MKFLVVFGSIFVIVRAASVGVRDSGRLDDHLGRGSYNDGPCLDGDDGRCDAYQTEPWHHGNEGGAHSEGDRYPGSWDHGDHGADLARPPYGYHGEDSSSIGTLYENNAAKVKRSLGLANYNDPQEAAVPAENKAHGLSKRDLPLENTPLRLKLGEAANYDGDSSSIGALYNGDSIKDGLSPVLAAPAMYNNAAEGKAHGLSKRDASEVDSDKHEKSIGAISYDEDWDLLPAGVKYAPIGAAAEHSNQNHVGL